ncbi:uncharacterized protein [Miscanthus floridulus]|uniref:uncharacterized protein n=1 Tax=Miscanthus floridulus TaxID=154761 RepID=UPI00345A0FF3
MGRGPLDHLPDIGETVPGASVSSPAPLGGEGGDASGPGATRPGVEADALKARALGKRAVSPVGSTVEVEQVAAGATQLPLQRTERVMGSIGDLPAPANIEAVLPPPPPPSQRRVAVPKRRKRPADAPALAPLKALKVSPSSTTHWVVEAQATIQRGAASTRADLKEPVAQGGAVEELKARSLGRSVFLRRERDVWDQLQRQKDLLARANELLSVRSAEVEDLRLCGTDMDAAAVAAQEQVAPLAARVKELEEELTHMAELEGEASRVAEASRVKVQRLKEKAEASWVEAQRWKEKAEASRVEARHWEEKAEELETEVTRAAEASFAVQAVLETEIGEHDALKSAAHTAYEALEVEGVQSGSSLGSRLIALSGQVRERLRGALHMGVKRALAVIASHYIGVDLTAISDGYVLPDDDGEADEEVAKLMEAAKGPGMALAKLFEEEVVPSMPSADAGDPEA